MEGEERVQEVVDGEERVQECGAGVSSVQEGEERAGM